MNSSGITAIDEVKDLPCQWFVMSYACTADILRFLQVPAAAHAAEKDLSSLGECSD